MLAYCLLLGPAVLLVADLVGRLVVRPDEMPAGLVTAFVGGPVLIWMIRSTRVRSL